MSFAFTVQSGILKAFKVIEEGSYSYTHGLLSTGDNPVGIVLKVFGKRQEEFQSLKGQQVTVVGELSTEKESKQAGAKNQYVINVSDFGTNLNTVVICGRLSRDNESKYLDDGKAIASNCLAVNGKTKDAPTSWFDFSLFDKSAEVLGNFTSKGSLAGVIGRIKIDTWKDKVDNSDCYKFKVTGNQFKFVGGKKDNDQQSISGASASATASTDWDQPSTTTLMDNIPF